MWCHVYGAVFNRNFSWLLLVFFLFRLLLCFTIFLSKRIWKERMALIRAAASIGRRQAKFFPLSIPGPASNPLHRSVSYPHVQTGLRFSVRAVQGATVTPKKEDNDEGSSESWKVKMLYDGDCPLCMREVNMLRERNKNYKAIKFVDISSDEYSPQDNQGLDYQTVMGRIHAILSDGTVVKDVEAFRKLYEAVGLGWVYAITKYEPVASIADAVYGVWAKYRLQITGRPPLEAVLEARKKKEEMCNDSKAFKM